MAQEASLSHVEFPVSIVHREVPSTHKGMGVLFKWFFWQHCPGCALTSQSQKVLNCFRGIPLKKRKPPSGDARRWSYVRLEQESVAMVMSKGEPLHSLSSLFTEKLIHRKQHLTQRPTCPFPPRLRKRTCKRGSQFRLSFSEEFIFGILRIFPTPFLKFL